MSNTVGRAGSTMRTLTDPRKEWWAKGMNTLTGLRIADVSQGRKDAIIRERIFDRMKEGGASSFTRTFFSKEALARMTPEERAKAEELQALIKLLADRSKARKEAQAVAE